MDTPPQRGSTFRALRHRNFRLFMGGMIVSVVGTWMQQTAQGWLVYRLTKSEWMLGLTWFCANIPVLFLASLAGVAADRWPRRRIVIITQTLAMCQAAVLALLTWTGAVRPWHILVLALLLGVVNAFDVPGRQSLYIHLVAREDLLNAISLNSAMFNSARIAGPAAAGLLVAWAGEAVCFTVNAFSFLAVLASLFALRMNDHAPPVSTAAPRILDGLQRAWNTKPLRWILLTAGAVSFCAAPPSALGPIFADAIFHHGARGFGFLTSAMGAGAVLGTLSLARRAGTSGLPSAVASAALLMAGSLAVYAISPSFWITLAVMPFIGMATMRLNAGSQTLVQATAPDALRGRLMGLYTTMFLGMFPLGSLASGALAQRAGPRIAVMTGALLCLFAAAHLRWRAPVIERWVEENRT